MARRWALDWRRLALAATAAGALALVCAPPGEAQSAKKTKQKAAQPQKAEQPEQAEDADDAAKAAPKKKKPTAAEAQQAVEAASKMLEAGKADHAAQALTATLAGGRLPPAIMAKALLYRGIAYRQQKKPAQAIADLTSALWLKGGLAEADRKDALSQRAAAYAEAGLTESGEAVAAVPREAPRAPTRTASAAPPAATWGADTTTAAPSAGLAPQSPSQPAPAPPQEASPVWNPFGSLFGGNSTPAAPPQPAPAPQAPQPAAKSPMSILGTETAPVPVPEATARPKSATSAWSRNTEVRNGPAPVETASLPVKPEGKFRVQVGMVRTPEQAQLLVGKIKGQYAAVFGQREPEIDQAVVGNMGSFYRVRVGPFASQQEGQAACGKLKGSGLDCLVVTQ